MHSNEIFQMKIRVPKEDSAFLYFQLEANEGLSFYSTLHHEVGSGFRDIEINSPECFKKELERLINKLSETLSITILNRSF